jgi:hypothetical protein
MTEIKAGKYTVQDLLDAADFDVKTEAAVDYNESGYDLRRVQVGGLPFNDLEQVIEVPESATEVEVTLDQGVVATLQVTSDES